MKVVAMFLLPRTLVLNLLFMSRPPNFWGL